MRQTRIAVGQNFLAGMMGGVQAGQQMRQANDQNALRGLMANADLNDPNLASQVAQYDPQMGMQLNQQNYQRGRQQKADARADQQFAMQVEAHAAKMSAAERQQAAAEIRQTLTPAVVAHRQGPEQFEAWKQQNGALIEAADIDAASLTYENAPVVFSRFENIAEVFEQADASVPEGNNPSDRYRVVGSTLYDLTAEGGPQAVGQGQGQETVVMGADGQPVYIQGPAGTSAKFTETQSKDNVFATRMSGAMEILDQQLEDGTYLSDRLTSRADRAAEMAGGVTLGMSRELQDEDFQVAFQAGREYLLAFLRKDTGAAVTPQEEITYGEVYLPQPGDGPRVLEAKRLARRRGLAAVEAGMNPQQIAARDRALVRAARDNNGEPQTNTQPVTDADGGMPQGFAEQYRAAAEDAGITIEELWEAWPNK